MSFLPQYPQLTWAMRSVLERMARAGYPPLYTQTPQQARAAYEDKLRASGVAVDLEIYRGVTHEFIKMGRAIPEARQAHADAARALAGALKS